MEKKRRLLKEIRQSNIACIELRRLCLSEIKPFTELPMFAGFEENLATELAMAQRANIYYDDGILSIFAGAVLICCVAHRRELNNMLSGVDLFATSYPKLSALRPTPGRVVKVDATFEVLREKAHWFLHDKGVNNELAQAFRPIKMQRDGSPGWLRWANFYGYE